MPPFIQLAGAKGLLEDQTESRAMMDDFRRRRDIFISGLNEVEGMSCQYPDGAFYAFPNVSQIPMSADDFADYLLDEVGVATLPGSAFGVHADNHLRMCFANSVENLERAVDRIADAVKRL